MLEVFEADIDFSFRLGEEASREKVAAEKRVAALKLVGHWATDRERLRSKERLKCAPTLQNKLN